MLTLISVHWWGLWHLCTDVDWFLWTSDEHLCKSENARWSGKASCLYRYNYLCTLDGCWLFLVMNLISVHWWWLWHISTNVDSDIYVHVMARICVNAKMRDEVDRQVASWGTITCVLLSGVDYDIWVLVKTLTSSGYWLWLDILLVNIWYMFSQISLRFIRLHSQLRAHFR